MEQFCRRPSGQPGSYHYHDMDQLIIGNGCITHDEERTQMAIWTGVFFRLHSCVGMVDLVTIVSST